MNSKRLQFLASIIDKEAKVIDVGTDHAYLPIMLKMKNNQKVMGCDIHENTLKLAIKNLEQYQLQKEIPIIKSDGLNEVNSKDYDSIVLAGMGYHTIEHILNNKEKLQSIKRIYLQPNNDYAKVRKYMNGNGWKIIKEYLFKEKKHLYHMLVYEKGQEVLMDEEVLFGKYNLDYQWYYEQLLVKYQDLLSKIPDKHYKDIEQWQKRIKLLNNYLKKKN